MARLRLRLDRYLASMAALGYERQSQQAALIGVAEPTVSRVRAGQEPGPRFIAGLMLAFPNRDVGWFLAAEPEPGDDTVENPTEPVRAAA